MTKILIVDDESPLREMLYDILTDEQYEVITAVDGQDGLKKIYEESPDLVLLDCSMPVMDGYEMLAKMRSDPALMTKPVIMLTVLSSEHDEIKGLKLGVDDYITKPFKRTLLLARVKRILELREQSINVNPLTFLGGNLAIKTTVEHRIGDNLPFSMIYIDISNFKSFNDRYGFQRGDEVIKHTANTILKVLKEYGKPNDFVGHIGGDDFIVVTDHDRYPVLSEQIIRMFDRTIPDFYDLEDRKRGHIISTDRNNVEQKFPFMTIQLAVISSLHTKISHYGQLSRIAAELKKAAKQYNHSVYVVDRRKE